MKILTSTFPTTPIHQLLLLQHLLRHPERGDQIKHIRFPPKATWNRTLPRLDTRNLEALATRGTKTSRLTYANSYKQLDKGGFQVLLLILFSYCPNLESFALYDDLDKQEDCFWRLKNFLRDEKNVLTGEDDYQEDLPSAGFPLKKISSVEYYRSPRDATNSRLIEALFSLPRLRFLNLGIGKPSREFAPCCPSLARLVLKDAHLEEGYIGYFLDSAPNLKDLRLELVRVPGFADVFFWPSSGSGLIDCSAPKKSLANTSTENYLLPNNPFRRTRRPSLEGSQLFQTPRRKLLESLVITTKFGTFDEDIDLSLEDTALSYWGIKGSLESLKEFEVLKTLEVSLPVLLGWRVRHLSSLADCLPDSLVELTFRADMSYWKLYEWDVEAVRDLVEEFAGGGNRGNIKFLKYMLLEEHAGIDLYEGLLKDMHQTLAKVGIEFEVVEVSNPQD